MDASDLADVLDWRNEKSVRKNMLNDGLISMAEHQGWFERCRADDRCEWLVAELSNRPVGVVGITDLDKENRSCTWSMYLSKDTSMPGVGALMEFQTIERMFAKHKIRKIWGETLSSNKATLSLHRKFGFTEEGRYRRHVRRGDEFVDVVRLALFEEDWKAVRSSLLNLLSSGRPVGAGVNSGK